MCLYAIGAQGREVVALLIPSFTSLEVSGQRFIAPKIWPVEEVVAAHCSQRREKLLS